MISTSHQNVLSLVFPMVTFLWRNAQSLENVDLTECGNQMKIPSRWTFTRVILVPHKDTPKKVKKGNLWNSTRTTESINVSLFKMCLFGRWTYNRNPKTVTFIANCLTVNLPLNRIISHVITVRWLLPLEITAQLGFVITACKFAKWCNSPNFPTPDCFS